MFPTHLSISQSVFTQAQSRIHIHPVAGDGLIEEGSRQRRNRDIAGKMIVKQDDGDKPEVRKQAQGCEHSHTTCLVEEKVQTENLEMRKPEFWEKAL